MKITQIEVHEISFVPEEWISYELNHIVWDKRRVIYVVHTDNGLEGLGEGWNGPQGGPEPKAILDQYIGSNPFDWIGDETSLALGTAMYDLMGKTAGVPTYKLLGQKCRSWVPFSASTVPTHPSRMAEAVKRYAEKGYTWMKFHVSPFEDVIAQTKAMQAIAPPGFKIHYDFTRNSADNHMPELLQRLAEFPIAGCFEDPLPAQDLPGYLELRKRSPLPILTHHTPLDMTYDVMMGLADAYLMSWPKKIGTAMRLAGLFASGNIPFGFQHNGGNITRAMAAHLMAAFPTARFHSLTGQERYQEDVTKEYLEPINGFVKVPELPGLGITLDRDKLEKLKSAKKSEQKRWIIKSHFANGIRLFADSKLILDPHRFFPMRYDMPITTEYWDDDGSSEFKDMLDRVRCEGVILEK